MTTLALAGIYKEEDLPQSMVELGIPFEACVNLMLVLGGRRIYLPKTVSQRHPLAWTIGYENAKKLAKERGGLYLCVPQGEELLRGVRDRLIKADRLAGKSVPELSKEYNICERRIWQIMRKKTLGESRRQALVTQNVNCLIAQRESIRTIMQLAKPS